MYTTLAAPERWTDAFLDDMRQCGDPAADAAIELWRRRYGYDSAVLKDVAAKLIGSDASAQADALTEVLLEVDPGLARLLDPAERASECCVSDEEMSPAYALFQEHGLKILMILVFYSLPAAYAAQNGVRVLHSKSGSTGFLVEDLNRRLIETAQFVLEMFTPQGLNIHEHAKADAHGPAVLSALRVRLLHACVRAMIGAHRAPVWDVARFGIPANQEDAAGTFLTFSYVVIDGLRKLHLDVDPAVEEEYFNIWRKVGRLLGVDDALIPANLTDAKQLMTAIKERQIDAPIRRGDVNDLGQKMTASLLEFIRQSLPWPLRPFRRLPASVMRFFLPNDPVDVPTSLGIPRTFLLDEFVHLWLFIEARITRFRFYDALNRLVYREWGERDARARGLLQLSRFMNRRLVLHMQAVNRNQFIAQPKASPHLDLHDWDKTWAFDQANPVTRAMRRVRAAATKGRRS